MYSQDRSNLTSLKKQAAELLARFEKAQESCRKSKKRFLATKNEVASLREKCEDAKSEMTAEYVNYSRDLENDFEHARIAYFEAKDILKKAKQRHKILKLEHRAHQAERDALETKYKKCQKIIRQIEKRLRYARTKKG